MVTLSPERQAARLALVSEHVAHENRHDLDGIISTFGASARYDDEPWDAHYIGREGVREFYRDLLGAMPDLRIDVQQCHSGETAVILEVIVRGHHIGAWRGLPPTGRAVEFPLCGVFTFDNDDRLAGERIYYDRATILRQLGVLHEPDSVPGRISTVLTHPVTIARIIGRMLRKT